MPTFLGAGESTEFFWEFFFSRLSFDESCELLKDRFLVLESFLFLDWEVSCKFYETLLKHFSLFSRLFLTGSFYFDPFLCLLIRGALGLTGCLKKLKTVSWSIPFEFY